MKHVITSRKVTMAMSVLGLVSGVQASTDYGPAIWKPLCVAKYNTTGYGHKFFVVHDMEGYYAYTCSWFTSCNPPNSSVHFATNGKKDATSDAAAGEISQLGVRTAHYAWHARCWNSHSLGTEHEGFASNPAWYTDVQYEVSAACTKAMAEQFGFAKDRNHIVGHGEKSRSSWVTWANANLGIDATCNTHTDPGPYWDWTKYMNLVNGGVNNAAVVSMNYPATVTTGQSFSATVTMNNNGTTHWINANGHNLGSQNPQDNTRWGLGRVGFAGTISPGQNGAFTFNCTAPTTAGSYAFDWKMVQDGVEWFGATAGGGIQVNAPSTGVIVDNQAATYVGTWAAGSSSADKYGADYRYHSTAAVSEPATFTANIPGGTRNVYAWWPQGANRSTTAPYVVTHAAGSTTVNKNQQANGGSWQLLGNFNFNAGNNTVKLSCWTGTGFIVVADAVKFGD
jgi:N-acetyl-anhydromuramyl-L-alanine amidase AmpD